MARFFSSENLYGSSTSSGFANTNIVLVWDSKKNRDSYVNSSKNRTCQIINKSQVTFYASNEGKKPRAFSSEYWGIDPNTDWFFRFIVTPKGFLGIVQISNPVENLERVF